MSPRWSNARRTSARCRSRSSHRAWSAAATDADDLEPQRPDHRAHPRAQGARARPLGPRAVLAGDGIRRPPRADDRDGPGQRPHLRRQRRGARSGRDTRAAAAFRARGQRGARPLRLSAVQGRRHGDEPAVVRKPRRMAGRVREVDRPRRSEEPARRQHLLRLPRALGRAATRRCAARATSRRARAPTRASRSRCPTTRSRTGRRSTGAASSTPRTAGPTARPSTSRCRGSVPFVDAARIFALAAGITATNTVDRLTQAGAARGIPAAEVRAWCDAFEFIQLLRLREQHRRLAGNARTVKDDNPNLTPLRTLSELERRILKEAMRQIRKAAAAPRSRLSRMSATFASLRRWLGAERAAVVPQRWVVVDTETSGLSPERDRLLAIGGVAVDDEGIRVGDSFEVIVQGEPSGDAENIVVHGIGYGEQAAGTPAREALAALRRMGRGRAARGVPCRLRSDGASRRVGACRPRRRRPAVARPGTARRGARAGCHGHGGARLDDWLAAFGIECAVRHNAAADALAAAELLLRLRASRQSSESSGSTRWSARRVREMARERTLSAPRALAHGS